MSKLFIKNGFLVACNGLLALSAVGAWSQSETKDKGIEEVVVWGTEVNASSLSLNEEAIAIRQADHISDLLRTVPGVDVGGAHSLNQRITIRSMDDKDLNITIDGAQQNTYMYHHMGNLQIHADILKSVDIQVGSNSVVTGGLGGGVKFETRQASDLLEEGAVFGGRVQLGVADNASQSVSLTGYGQITDNVDVLAYFNTVDRDNYTVGGGKIKDSAGDEIPNTDGDVRGLDGELSDALIKFGWDISDSQRLTLGYEMYEDEGDYSYRPDMGLATDLAIAGRLGAALVYPTEFTRDTLTLGYQIDWSENSSAKFSVFNNESTLWRDESGLTTPPTYSIKEGIATNSGFNLLAQTKISTGINQELTYGFDVVQFDTDYRATTAGGVTKSDEEAKKQAVFIEDKIELTDGFYIIPGIRYENYLIDTAVIDETFSETTGALAFEYEFLENFLARASTTQLFKGPEIGEVFTGAGLGDAANPDIDAETGSNTELALSYQGDQFSVGITLFETEIENYIYDYTPAGKDNIGDMTLDGYEAFAGYHFNDLNILLSYSSSDSELDAFSEYADRDGARIDRKQGDTLSLNIDYLIESIDLSLHWDTLIVDDLDAGRDLDGPTLDNSKDGYTVHNIAVRWTPTEFLSGLSLTFGVDNLFDEFYASQSSRTGASAHPFFGELYLFDYEPGRNIKATVSYQF
ncbi:MAG: TonB-dependent receptor domain-containing protein [Cellvibrionaceae bacterium]